MNPEFTRLTFVYAHLIACCVAVGLVLVSDVTMLRQLLWEDPYQRMEHRLIEGLQNTVSLALVGLWITGAAIIAMDVSNKGLSYLSNSKLEAKLILLSLLTFNGLLLHRYALPLMRKAGSLLNLSFGQRSFAALAGTISAVSWLYAALMGVGRPLSWKYSLTQLLAVYPVLIATGFAGMMLLLSWAVPPRRSPTRPRGNPLRRRPLRQVSSRGSARPVAQYAAFRGTTRSPLKSRDTAEG
jgi:hypothetical protein